MKNNYIYKAVFTMAIILGLSSCDDRELISAENSAIPVSMDLSTSNLVLDQNFPANPALTVTWTAAQYSVPVEVKYTVEISSTVAFTTPILLANTVQSQTRVVFSTKEMNEFAKKINLVPNEFQKMYFRVKSYSGNNSLGVYSKVTSLNIKPYTSSPTYAYQDLFLIGSAAIGNWENNASNSTLLPLLKTVNPSVYIHIGFFKSGAGIGFKMIKVKGSYDAQFGKAAEGILSTDGGSENLTVPTDGYYKLTVDTAALTYSLVPITAPATIYSNISIIGTVNGNFNNDTQMTQSSFDPHSWRLIGASLTAGEFKFRANNNWDVNWGTNSEYFGTGTNNGSNIPLNSEWTYDIYFNDISGDYTIIPVK